MKGVVLSEVTGGKCGHNSNRNVSSLLNLHFALQIPGLRILQLISQPNRPQIELPGNFCRHATKDPGVGGK